MALYQSQDLIYAYPESKQPALKNVNLKIAEGEFLLLIGGSGSGKSTLLRALAGLVPEFYGGCYGGNLFFRGQEVRKIDRRLLTREVGMVFQDPEKQLVMTGVEAEIAFGLENLGLPPQVMKRRVAEVMSYLGLTGLQKEFTVTLSGGQKQKLALASVLAMQPRVLLLDEPTSQLDPLAAEEFLNLVKRLNEEMGLTIVLVEQRLERCFHLADRVWFMEAGELSYTGTPKEFAQWAVSQDIPFVPPVASFFAAIGSQVIPTTVKEGRRQLKAVLGLTSDRRPVDPRELNTKPTKPMKLTKPTRPGVRGVRGRSKKLSAPSDPFASSAPRLFFKGQSCSSHTNQGETISERQQLSSEQRHRDDTFLLTLKNVWFTYPNGKEALQKLNLQINTGELVAVLGPNGAGKSTLLKTMVGLLKPGQGQVIWGGQKGQVVWGRQKFADPVKKEVDAVNVDENKDKNWLQKLALKLRSMNSNKKADQVLNKGQDKVINKIKVAYLSQHPGDYLFHDTVEKELQYTLHNYGLVDDGVVDELLETFHLQDSRLKNPRDLSSGERQRIALASVLVTRPQLIVLDEPTRGMDYRLKEELGKILRQLVKQGASVILVTHDVEFAARYASRVVMLYDGRIISDGATHQVLGQSFCYSTQMAKLWHGLLDNLDGEILTVEQAQQALARYQKQITNFPGVGVEEK